MFPRLRQIQQAGTGLRPVSFLSACRLDFFHLRPYQMEEPGVVDKWRPQPATPK